MGRLSEYDELEQAIFRCQTHDGRQVDVNTLPSTVVSDIHSMVSIAVKSGFPGPYEIQLSERFIKPQC